MTSTLFGGWVATEYSAPARFSASPVGHTKSYHCLGIGKTNDYAASDAASRRVLKYRCIFSTEYPLRNCAVDKPVQVEITFNQSDVFILAVALEGIPGAIERNALTYPGHSRDGLRMSQKRPRSELGNRVSGKDLRENDSTHFQCPTGGRQQRCTHAKKCAGDFLRCYAYLPIVFKRISGKSQLKYAARSACLNRGKPSGASMQYGHQGCLKCSTAEGTRLDPRKKRRQKASGE